MPPKRKATTNDILSPPRKRAARSNQLLEPESATSNNSTPTKKVITYGRTASRTAQDTTGSSKENHARASRTKRKQEAEGSSEDELRLSPAKSGPKQAPTPKVKRPARLSPDTSSLSMTNTPSRKNGMPPTKRQPRPTLTHDDDGEGQTTPALGQVVRTSRTNKGELLVDQTPRTSRTSRTAPSATLGISNVPTIPSRSTSRKEPATNGRERNSIAKPPPRKHKTSDVPIGPPTPNKKNQNGSRHRSPSPAADFDEDIPTQLSPLKFDSVLIPSKPPRPSTPARPTPSVVAIPPTPQISPKKAKQPAFPTPARLPRILSEDLYPCLNAQKKAILRALQQLPDGAFGVDEDNAEGEVTPNAIALSQLTNLLSGTVTRGEGNSCLVLGPRGSGKTSIVEQGISNFPRENPIILRLSGYTQHTDRLAMQEIAYQLGQQTGKSFLSLGDDSSLPQDPDDRNINEPNPFLDSTATSKISLPPSSHLPALISVLPTLSRPTVVVLDGFDLFALHPRQSLLYCLLDTVQSCRAGAGSRGLAVIGVTNRIDTITVLEKRVKSRFSGRMIRCAPPRRMQDFNNVVKAILSSDLDYYVGRDVGDDNVEEWKALWDLAIKTFLDDSITQTVLLETFSISQDVRLLTRLLLPTVLGLSSASPFPSSSRFAPAALAQCSRPRFPLLHTLTYPSLCLLIASVHADTAGHAIFTFEMLHEYFLDQVRSSTSAPVQVNGGSIGMVRCSRPVLMTAFEDLVHTQVLVPASVQSQSIAKEYIKYRSVLNREEVKKAVETTGQVNLRKWLTKAT